ncbi:MAG: dockerin type I repeat-containing protein [Ruminococcus sp.]|nr:dockerin type I repeat-containing protein [Ruminococcus sp.]
MTNCKTRRFLGIILVLVAMFGILLYPMHGIRTSAAEDYRMWRQADPRWGSINLGSSSQTMSSSGCLVTSLAILAVHSGAKDPESFNPGTFAESLNSINAFSGGAIASWGKITEVVPEIKFVKKYSFTSSTQSGKAAEMQAIFEEGYYMTCNVGGHWVFVEDIVGSEVYMIDPAKDETNLFDAYSLYNITELRVFTGKNPPQSSSAASQPTTQAPTAAPTTEKWKLGEYYASNASADILASANASANVIETLLNGYIVEITAVNGDWGCIQLGAEKGWINMNDLTYAGAPINQASGDINNDKKTDRLDLALLNEYIASLSELPDGISMLRECEINAADINGDGIVDNSDVLRYLALICE